ncbi:cytochrome P450 [Sorangium sp. So ce1335]|uniref:cytochrome P450 n=1 Tax=Sorangium sp. So ce1335 TaxID=3133335 RepID=UPI003F5FF98A
MDDSKPSSVLDFSVAQPHPLWAKARAACPVLRFDATSINPAPTFVVSRHEDAERVLRDPETFSSAINNEVVGKYMGESMLGMDGGEHRRYRSLVAHAFRASVLERWDEALVRPTIHALLDGIAPAGRADLLRDVVLKYPVQVICGIIGVPLHDQAQFARWSDEIVQGALNPPLGVASSRAMRGYLAGIIEARRREPAGDLISELLAAEIDGQRLTEERIYGFLLLLLPAGAETTFRALGNALVALLTRPAMLAQVVADRSLIPAVVEETLRWETSVTLVSRVATRDTEIAGCPIPAGAVLNVLTGSAGRDEARYEAADAFRLDRPPRPHLAFGAGPHTCLGVHLARLEMRVGLDAILDRLPDLRLDPDAPAPEIKGFAFRNPDAIHVLFGPS